MKPTPSDMLPGAMRGTVLGDLADMFAERWGVPGLMAVSNGLGVAAASTRGRYRVQIRSGAAFPLGLYLVVLAPPASLKSPTLSALGGPLADLQATLVESQGPTLTRERAEAAALGKALKGKEDELARMLGAGKRQEADALRVSIEQLAQERQQHTPVGINSIIFGADLTYEALVNRAADNGERVAVMSAEGQLLENLAGRTSDGSTKSEFLNSAYDLEPYERERVIDGNRMLRAPWASLLFSVQPDVMATLLGNAHMRRRGFLQRFWFTSSPRAAYRNRHDLPPLDRALMKDWADRIGGIWHRVGDPIILGPGPGIDLLRDFENSTIRPLVHRSQDESDLLAGWLSKAAMTSVRVAAVLQLLDQHQADTLGVSAAESAVAYAEAVVEHTSHLFTASAQSAEGSPRGRVLRWLAAAPHPPNTPNTPNTPSSGGYGGIGGVGVTTREVWQRFRDQAWCRRADDVREVLADLASLGWIDGPYSDREGAGRPSEGWQLHPDMADHHRRMTGSDPSLPRTRP